MKIVDAPPGAKRLMESLRDMGYTCSTAIADVIDNSLSADASSVHVNIHAREGTTPAYVAIADNGKGMNERVLIEAMRYGADQKYSEKDLGKYGLGLKTGSLSQCRRLTVMSRTPATGRKIMRWNLDHVYKTDRWQLQSLDFKDLKDWEQAVLDHKLASSRGTVVLWSDLDTLPLLDEQNVSTRNGFLETLSEEVKAHLEMVFHRFLEGDTSSGKKIKILFGEDELEPWDPFCQNESTRKLEKIQFAARDVDTNRKAKGKVTVSPFVLPKESEFSSREAWRAATGPKNWNRQQGLYFYRNDRLLQAGGWSGIRTNDEHTKLLRVAIEFPSDLDSAFSINVTKMKAKVPEQILDKTSSKITQWIKVAKERYARKDKSTGSGGTSRPEGRKGKEDKEEKKESGVVTSLGLGPISLQLANSTSKLLTVIESARPGQIKIAVPQKHDFASVFESSLGSGTDLKKLIMALFFVLEGIKDENIFPDAIPLDSIRRMIKKNI